MTAGDLFVAPFRPFLPLEEAGEPPTVAVEVGGKGVPGPRKGRDPGRIAMRRLALRRWLAGLVLWAAFGPGPLPVGAQGGLQGDELRAAKNRAEELFRKGQLPAAAAQYERALELAPRVYGIDSLSTAVLHTDAADVYQEMGRYDRAEVLFRRALEIKEAKRGKDNPEVATCLSNLANLYTVMARYEQAEQLLRRALEIHETRQGKDHVDVAHVLNLWGFLYQVQGKYEEAVPLQQRSLAIREATLGKDHPDVAYSLAGLGNLYRDLGRYEKAESLFRRSLEIWQGQPGKAEVAIGLNNLAVVYRAMGRDDKAEPLLLQALEIVETQRGKNSPATAIALDNLAGVYLTTGRYEKAESLHRRSLAVREALYGKDHPKIAVSLNNLAQVYKGLKKLKEAQSLYERSLAIAESRLGKDHPNVGGVLQNLAGLYADPALGRCDEAEALYRRSLAIFEARLGKDHPSVAADLRDLGGMYKDLGRYEEAEPLYRRALAIREATLGPDHVNVAISRYYLARLEAARERWSDAVAGMDRSRRIIRQHLRRALSALPERDQLVFLQRTDADYFHNALSLGLARREDNGLAAQSAAWLLNGKAVAQEALAQRALLARAGTDPRTAELAEQLKEVRRRLAQRTLSAPRPGQEAAYQRELERLGEREQDLSRRLGQAAGLPTRDDPWVGLDDVRKALAAGTVLVEIARFRMANFPGTREKQTAVKRWLGERYAAWVVPAAGQGDVRLIDLGEAETIDRAVQAARTALQGAAAAVADKGEPEAEKELRQPLAEVAQRILHPLLEHIGKSKQWVLSPDAALWLVPWAALPLPDGKYAVEEHTIRYVVSGRDLATPPARGTPGRSRIVADPDYDLGPVDAVAQTTELIGERNSTELRGLLPAAQLPRRVPRLSGTAVEAAAIKGNLEKFAGQKPWLYRQGQALEGVVKAFQSPRVLVLSTHGYFLSAEEKKAEDQAAAGVLENPLLRCGLLLAGCNQRDKATGPKDEDGVLTGMEILEMDLQGTELVVLSACETGLGDVRGGEGVAGLRQAFQLAGARTVVATLWQIPDRETARLMNDFFAHLAFGQDKAEALRQAQLKLIEARRQRDGAAHPLFWAAFTLTGQGQ